MDAVLDGEAREEGVRGARRRVPEPVVRGERAVVRPSSRSRAESTAKWRPSSWATRAKSSKNSAACAAARRSGRRCPRRGRRPSSRCAPGSAAAPAGSARCRPSPAGRRDGGSSRTAALRAGGREGARGGRVVGERMGRAATPWRRGPQAGLRRGRPCRGSPAPSPPASSAAATLRRRRLLRLRHRRLPLVRLCSSRRDEAGLRFSRRRRVVAAGCSRRRLVMIAVAGPSGTASPVVGPHGPYGDHKKILKCL